MEDIDPKTVQLMLKFRRIAFVAVVFSTASLFLGIVTIPLAYQKLQKLHSEVQLEMDYCKLRNRDLWRQVIAVELIKGDTERASRIARQSEEWETAPYASAGGNLGPPTGDGLGTAGGGAQAYSSASGYAGSGQRTGGINVERAGYGSYGAPGIIPPSERTGTGDGGWPRGWGDGTGGGDGTGARPDRPRPTQHEGFGPGDIPGFGRPRPGTRTFGWDERTPNWGGPQRTGWAGPGGRFGPNRGGYEWNRPVDGGGGFRDGGQCCTCHQGPPGLPGQPGPDGRDGNHGRPGGDGEPGKDGFTTSILIQRRSCIERPCPSGPPGRAGLPGHKGQPGFPGDPGKSGEPGIPGPKGPPGQIGRSGLDGLLGLKGRRGPTGNIFADMVGDGLRGPPGPPGVPGRLGEAGNPGLDGPPGRPGPDGDSGEDGSPGAPGPKGLPGPDGLRGSKGSCDHCSPPRTAGGY